MKKVPFLALLGLLLAAPLTAQKATVSHVNHDLGPYYWPVENPCNPGEWLRGDYTVKGQITTVENSQGSHYTITNQYYGEWVGDDPELVFTLHNPALNHRFSNDDNQIVGKYKDRLLFVGKRATGVEQKFEFVWASELHVLPDGTVHSEGWIDDRVCLKKK